jgi:hypothetical protein
VFGRLRPAAAEDAHDIAPAADPRPIAHLVDASMLDVTLRWGDALPMLDPAIPGPDRSSHTGNTTGHGALPAPGRGFVQWLDRPLDDRRAAGQSATRRRVRNCVPHGTSLALTTTRRDGDARRVSPLGRVLRDSSRCGTGDQLAADPRLVTRPGASVWVRRPRRCGRAATWKGHDHRLAAWLSPTNTTLVTSTMPTRPRRAEFFGDIRGAAAFLEGARERRGRSPTDVAGWLSPTPAASTRHAPSTRTATAQTVPRLSPGTTTWPARSTTSTAAPSRPNTTTASA